MVQLRRSILSKTSDRGSIRSFLSDVSFRIARTADSFFLDLNFTKHKEEKNEGRFVTNCCTAVLSQCADELLLLTSVFTTAAEPYSVLSLEYKSIDERFRQTVGKFEDYRINAQYTDMHKLQKDIALIIYLVQSLIAEVLTYGTFSDVTNYMQNLEDMSRDEELLIKGLLGKLEMIQYMRSACVKEKSMSSTVLISFKDTIKEAMRLHQEQREYRKEEVKFVRKWQKARHEQNKLKLAQKELGYKSTTEALDRKINIENRCHKELEAYILESHEDYMDEIQNWMEQYDRDMENLDLDIYNMKLDVEKLTDKHQALKEEYDIRAQKMTEWLECKRKKKEEEDRIIFENWAATKIQAWWRGVMVRKKLGPYKKQKGKKGAKAKGNKKGKKK